MIVKIRLQRVTATIKTIWFDSVQSEARLSKSIMAEVILSLPALVMSEPVKKSCRTEIIGTDKPGAVVRLF